MFSLILSAIIKYSFMGYFNVLLWRLFDDITLTIPTIFREKCFLGNLSLFIFLSLKGELCLATGVVKYHYLWILELAFNTI